MLKIRDLSVTKNYRDAIKKWGEPDISRKRVIIAPPMAGAAAKNVDLRPMKTTNQGLVTFSGYAAQQIEMLFRQIKLDGNRILLFLSRYIGGTVLSLAKAGGCGYACTVYAGGGDFLTPCPLLSIRTIITRASKP